MSLAIFHPNVSPAGAPASELRVRRALASLDDNWHIMHQVRWQGVRAGRQGDGEADFVIFHAQHGFLVLEVKGGRIAVVNGHWFATDRRDVVHAIKDPFVQATASKHALLACLKEFVLQPPPICHAVLFPNANVTGPIGMQPRAIVIDGADLATPVESIQRVLSHWQQLSSAQVQPALRDRIIERLAPTVVIRRRLRLAIAEAEEQLVSLTARQISLLTNFRRIRRCVVTGGAGTGKTILAVEKARQLSNEGARVLFVCFNALLASQLRADLRETSVSVRTFHALCLELSGPGGSPSRARSSEWWTEKAADDLRAGAEALTARRYDALIVDEAQDFTRNWLDSLESLLAQRSAAFVYLFADPHQCLFQDAHALPDEWPSVELDVNCRNTREIASAAALVIGDLPTPEGPEGRPISFLEAAPRDVPAIAQSVVARLLREESLDPRDVVMLCDTRALVERMRVLTAGGHSFVEPGQGGVLVETIQRFKGLEASVIVLALVEPPAALDNRTRALLYVAASRARSFLVVIGSVRVKGWFARGT